MAMAWQPCWCTITKEANAKHFEESKPGYVVTCLLSLNNPQNSPLQYVCGSIHLPSFLHVRKIASLSTYPWSHENWQVRPGRLEQGSTLPWAGADNWGQRFTVSWKNSNKDYWGHAYLIFKFHPQNKSGGGVMAYINDNVNIIGRTDLENQSQLARSLSI